MKPRKPASPKARELLDKLLRLADPANKGAPAECAAAKKKADRLQRAFDFNAVPEMKTGDIFVEARTFRKSSQAVFVASLERAEMDIASCVKWAIEGATPIRCVFTGDTLRAEADGRTAAKLQDIASRIIGSFRAVLTKFAAVDGVTTADRASFLMGLADGMMGEKREAGQRLPSRLGRTGQGHKAGRRRAVTTAPKLNIHPYYIALPLGGQIRFSAAIEKITADLEQQIHPKIAA